MVRGSILALMVTCCFAPLAAEGQTRASTFPRHGIKTIAAPHAVRTANSGFRGFRGAVPFFGGASGLSYGYGHEQSLLYRLGRIPVPPYFALHPPVYYTEPIALPYGDSPYARGPGCGLHSGVAKSAVIVNPHFTPKVKQEEVREKTVSNTKFIVNPFYRSAQEQLATNK